MLPRAAEKHANAPPLSEHASGKKAQKRAADPITTPADVETADAQAPAPGASPGCGKATLKESNKRAEE
jgi:hypothetical protein